MGKFGRSDIVVSYALFLVALIFSMMASFLEVSPEVSSDYYQKFCALTNAEIAELASLFFISYAVMQIPNGIILDRYGIKLILPLSILIVVAGTLVHWFVVSPTGLAISRILIGLGCSTAYVSAIYICSRYFPIIYFPILIGVIEFINTTGEILATNALNSLLLVYGWGIFHLLLIIGALVLFLLSLVALIPGLRNNARTARAGNISLPQIFTHIKEILCKRNFVYTILFTFFIWMGMMTFAGFWGKEYFERVHFYSANSALYVVEFYWLGFLIVTLFVGPISSWYRHRKTFMLQLTSVGVVASIVMAIPVIFPWWLLVVCAIAIGGSSTVVILSFSYINDFIDPKFNTTAMAVNNTTMILGGFVGEYLFALSLHALNLGERFAFPFNSAYYTALLIVPLSFILALICLRKA